jgi:ureidoacrylate peracid hydrolase
MTQLNGSTAPYAASEWPLVPHETAIICIDVQNDVLHPEGQYARTGIDISHMQRVIAPIRELVGHAREVRVPIIWTRHGFQQDSDGGILFPLRPFLREAGFRQGTWGYELLAELSPQPDDRFIDKNRFSCFYQTNLELILRGLGIQTLVVTGVLTNQCVMSTARDAFHRDIMPVLVEECCGTTLPDLHEPALRMVEVGFGCVRTLAQVVEELNRFPANVAVATGGEVA